MHLAFDLDGVLLDSESDLGWLNRALEGALTELGVEPTDEALDALYPPTIDRIEAAAREHGLPAERLWHVRNEHYVEAKLSAIESGELAPFEDVRTLDGLATRYELHVISNSPERVVRSFVERYGYDDLFGARIGRQEGLEDLRRLKPDPYMYHRLVADLDGETPVAYVGDTDSDRAFAEATGMRFVHLPRDGSGVGSLRSLPGLL